MRIVVLTVLVATVIWDGFTTLFGNINVLGDGTIQMVAALLFTVLVMSFMLSTRKIMHVRRGRGGFVAGLLVFFWIAAIFFDFFTSWIGNTHLLLNNSSDFGAYVVLFGLTLLGSSAPILLSVLWPWATSSEKPKQRVRATA